MAEAVNLQAYRHASYHFCRVLFGFFFGRGVDIIGFAFLLGERHQQNPGRNHNKGHDHCNEGNFGSKEV